ncbi:MAG TPA: hypothetical protein VGP04_14625, partial [Pseudonocardiaceae bacterium]|nr:hypothetical protein [Pseudonocardiaceae bacterium]
TASTVPRRVRKLRARPPAWITVSSSVWGRIDGVDEHSRAHWFSLDYLCLGARPRPDPLGQRCCGCPIGWVL